MKFISLVAFIVLFAAVCTAQSGTTILNENFDSYSVGSIPTGWVAYYSGDGASGVTASQSVSQPNSFKLSSSPSYDARYDRPFTVTVGDSLVISLMFKGDPSAYFRPVWYVRVGNLEFGGGYDPSTGRISWVNGSSGSAGSTISKGNWYSVKIVFKKASNRVDYYLNGKPEVLNCTAVAPFDNALEGITLYSANGGSGVIYYDDVAVVGYPASQVVPSSTVVNENFDSYSVGSIPTGWVAHYSGDGASGVTAGQSVSPPNSFKLSSSPSFDARYDKPFTVTVADSLVTTLMFKGDPSAYFRPVWYVRVGNLEFGGGYDPSTGRISWVNGSSGSVGSSISKGNWYSVRIVFKKASNRVDYYLNGKPEVLNCTAVAPFDNAPEGITLYSANGGSGVIYYDDISVVNYPVVTAVGVKQSYETPSGFVLNQNYPNPFNPSTKISYELPLRAEVQMNIYDVAGKLVKSLVNAQQDPGLHALVWDGRDSNGRQVPSGTYFYRISAGAFSCSNRMLLLK